MPNKNSPDVILDQYTKAISMEVEDNPESIPEEFLFTSKLIVLSQETEIPAYIPQDILSFQLNYGRKQAVEQIDQSLEGIGTEYPELTLEDKREVLSFIRKHKSATTEVSLKTFLHIALLYKTRDPSKEVWMLSQLQ